LLIRNIILIFFISFIFISCENPYFIELLNNLIKTVSFNINGADGESPEDIVFRNETVSFTFPDDSNFSRTGYIYGGWNTRADGTGNNYDMGDSFATDSSINFYARWTPINYFVKYDKNHIDATGVMADSTHTYDVPQALTPHGFFKYRLGISLLEYRK